MGLAEALVSIPQSERGGEIAQRGFDYQTCWALSQMLEYELDEKTMCLSSNIMMMFLFLMTKFLQLNSHLLK
ncbi:hypothetical protein OOC_10421 [Providencia rettgeri Dmel1]|nr:hypothetical protein OOC_10421 [Providencia rettgeri Dmel1]